VDFDLLFSHQRAIPADPDVVRTAQQNVNGDMLTVSYRQVVIPA
jgi:hypothetical protein